MFDDFYLEGPGMYNPTTRLLTILELLQSRPGLSGEEMARRLEVDIRTVRRYVTMLQDMGMPVEGSRGPGGGYQLRPGFKLPPLLFTEDEATAVVLGLLGTQWLQIAIDPVAVQGALAKVYRVLPLRGRERLQGISSHISVMAHGDEARPDAALLVNLSDAIHTRHRICIEYRSPRSDETAREVDPYGVVGWRGRWYMVGYCHLRQGLRIFRLDRMAGVQTLATVFEPPEGFDPLAHVTERLGGAANPWAIEVSGRSGGSAGQDPAGVWPADAVAKGSPLRRQPLGLADHGAIPRAGRYSLHRAQAARAAQRAGRAGDKD
jgi:predicted DNA-binding transcriptional regulator YafY